MELDQIWDEGFFSMVSEELDYEFDENDLFTDTEDILSSIIKLEDSEGVSNFIQSNLDCKSSLDGAKLLAPEEEKPVLDNKHALKTISFDNSQNSVDSGFSNTSIKTEIEQRDSTTDFSNSTDKQIIIDARIFLDPCNQPLNSASSNSNENLQVGSRKSVYISPTRKKEKTGISNVAKKGESAKEKRTIKTGDEKKHISNTLNEKLKKSHTSNFDRHEYKEHTKNKIKVEKGRQDSLKFLPVSTSTLPVDPGRECKPDVCKSTGTEMFSGKKHKTDTIKTKLDIEKKEHSSPVHSNNDRKYNNKPNSEIQKNKKYVVSNFTVDSTPDKKDRLRRRKIKVDPDVLISQKDGKNEDVFERVEFEENVKLKIDKRNINTEESELVKSQVSTEKKSSKATKLKPKEKNSLPLKLESNHLADVQSQVEPTSGSNSKDAKDVDQVKCQPDEKYILKCKNNWKLESAFPKLVLERIKTKEETCDKKPLMHLNLLHLPKARVVLRKLTEEELRSPTNLLRRVKAEINANISQKLRLQGKASNKDFIQLYCCQCKKLQMDRSGYTKLKNCDHCNSQLIYVCIKCNEKNYVSYDHLRRHLKNCRGSGETKPPLLDSIVLHRCTQCTFKTTNASVMASHIKSKRHKANGEIDVEKVLKRPKARVKHEAKDPPASSKIPRFAQLIIKQNDKSTGSITERYCVKCVKPRSSKTRKPQESCHRCKAQLHLRCLNCSYKCGSYDTMLRHLRAKCQPNEFKCLKCDYTNSTRLLVQQHVMQVHANELSKSDLKSKSKKRHRQEYACNFCDFSSYYQHSVTRHMQRLHKK